MLANAFYLTGSDINDQWTLVQVRRLCFPYGKEFTGLSYRSVCSEGSRSRLEKAQMQDEFGFL